MEILEVLAVAQAAFRINSNKVVGLADPPKGMVPNCKLMRDHFDQIRAIEVTDEDRATANEMRGHIAQRLMLNKLSDWYASEFVEVVGELVAKSTVTRRELSSVAWAPRIYADMVTRDQATVALAHYTGSSKFSGKLKEKIQVNFTPITVKYSRDYYCFRHLGHDEYGNLIGFMHKERLSGRIAGRVKRHVKSDNLNRASITYINNVKAVDD